MIKDGDWQNGPDIQMAVKFPEVSDIDEDIYLLDTQGVSGHEMYYHDLEVVSSNPGRVELRVHGTSVLSRTRTKKF